MNEVQESIEDKIYALVKAEFDCQVMLITDCERTMKKMQEGISDVEIKEAFYCMKKAALQKILDAMESIREPKQRTDLTVDVEGIEN